MARVGAWVVVLACVACGEAPPPPRAPNAREMEHSAALGACYAAADRANDAAVYAECRARVNRAFNVDAGAWTP